MENNITFQDLDLNNAFLFAAICQIRLRIPERKEKFTEAQPLLSVRKIHDMGRVC